MWSGLVSAWQEPLFRLGTVPLSLVIFGLLWGNRFVNWLETKLTNWVKQPKEEIGG